MPGSDDGRPLSNAEAPEKMGLFGRDLERVLHEKQADRVLDLPVERRFTRAREILNWLTVKSHYMEPPAFLLYADGSGTLFVGEKTLATWPELTKEISRVVGSNRWGTRRRENGAEEITLHVCGLELEEPIPGVD